MTRLPAVSIPEKEVSAWVAETSPKAARAWMEALPMADSAESGREIYQSLYTLNRMALPAQDRLKLMELYEQPVMILSDSLRGHLARAPLPLTPKKRQVAEFVRQLHLEMAIGYKCVIHDAGEARLLWGRKRLYEAAIRQAIFYLGAVLRRSYQVYIPYPAGVWREIHALYRYAEESGWEEETFADRAGNPMSIRDLYLRTVLLGLSNPYQLPQGEYRQVHELLEHWAGKVEIRKDLVVPNTVGHFLVDFTVDGPPSPFPRDVHLEPATHLRVINALGLASTVQGFVNRIKKGVPAASLPLGADCLESHCLDMLRRMIRSWGLAARRQQSRSRRKGYCFVANGLNAFHFFSSGQKPFAPPGQPQAERPAPQPVELPDGIDQDSEVVTTGFVDLADKSDGSPVSVKPGLADPLLRAQEVYRVERWQTRDESAGGLLLVSNEHLGSHIKVGEVVGIQDVADPDRWRLGAVRWLKSPGTSEVELGVEMLSERVTAVAVKMEDGGGGAGRFMQALLLPPVPALHRPASLVIPSEMHRPGQNLWLAEADSPPRRIKELKLLERTGSFAHIIFANRASE